MRISRTNETDQSKNGSTKTAMQNSPILLMEATNRKG